MTIIDVDSLSPGDLVEVDGYGGFATVLHIEQDGFTPPPRSVPKYRVTVQWGPNNTRHNSSCKRNLQTPGSKTRTGTLIEDFALGRLRPPGYVEEAQHLNKQLADNIDAIDDMDEAQILARIAELKSKVIA